MMIVSGKYIKLKKKFVIVRDISSYPQLDRDGYKTGCIIRLFSKNKEIPCLVYMIFVQQDFVHYQ